MTVVDPTLAKAGAKVKPSRGRVARERAAWAFVAPALLAIGLFFAIPVIAALLLSLTDFDIYALANLDNLRFVGCRTMSGC